MNRFDFAEKSEDHTLENRHGFGGRRRNHHDSRSPSVEHQQDLLPLRPSNLQASRKSDPTTASQGQDVSSFSLLQRRPSASDSHSFGRAVAEAAALAAAAAAHAATADVGSGTRGSSTRSGATPSAATVPLTQLSMDYFTVVGTIGHGAFGKVMLVRDKVNKKPYALKVLSKTFIARHGSFLSVRQEIETLKLCRGHPYIVQLHYAFQDAHYVFMVLDFVRGGSLDSIIDADGPLTGRQTLFFGAQLVLSLGHLHACGLVYFDLKLENILVHTSGHLALADMGLSYRQDRLLDEAPLICGTPAYMAPEQVRCGGNGLLSEEIQKTVDWWALGLVLYEMNTGMHPFHSGSNLKANFVKILKCEVDYRGMCDVLASLIRALLHTDYRRRLGYGPDGTQNVQAHPAFNCKSTGNGGKGKGKVVQAQEAQEAQAQAATGGHKVSSAEAKPAAGGVSAHGRRSSGRNGGVGGVGQNTSGNGGICVDWTALAARKCKPLFLPEPRSSIVDKDDTDIEYGMDPRSRSNTAAHRSAATAELSPESKDEFTKKLAPFRAGDVVAQPVTLGRPAFSPNLPDEDPSPTTAAARRSNHLPLRRSSTAGPFAKRSTSVDSGLNQMGDADSLVAMPPSQWGTGKDGHPSSTADRRSTASGASGVGHLPDELDIRVNAVTSTEAQWRAAYRTPRSSDSAITR